MTTYETSLDSIYDFFEDRQSENPEFRINHKLIKDHFLDKVDTFDYNDIDIIINSLRKIGYREDTCIKVNKLLRKILQHREKEILKGVNLTINTGEVHAIMGPNGNGKSTLLSSIMGHPKYSITEGSITYNNEDVLAMSVDERSRKGLFLGMQYPQEIPGITNSDFIRTTELRHEECVKKIYNKFLIHL